MRKSPRYASVDCIRQMIDYISGKISTVVLLVNPTRDYVHKIIKTLQPSFLQFHGDETPKFCNQFDYPYIKAIRVSPDLNIERAIEKSSNNDQSNFENIRYEGFGPSKSAVIVEALTDNKNRTA